MITEINERIQMTIKKRSICFVISDFLDDNNFMEGMKLSRRKHDVVAIRLFDEQEMHLPKIGFIQLYNAETNERTWVNSNSPKIQKEFEEVFSKQIAATEKGFKRSGIDFTTIRTDQNFIRPLVELFHRR